jgi:hypothetical protein
MPLNVPTQYKSMPGRQTHMRTLWRTLNKLKWLAFNILGPEWPFVKAMNSWINAKKLERRFDIYKGIDDVTWTRSHTQLASVGGFVIIFGPGTQKPAGQGDVGDLSHPVACIGGHCREYIGGHWLVYTCLMLTAVSGGVLRSHWPFSRRRPVPRQAGAVHQDAQISTENSLADQRSSLEDPEEANRDILMVTLGEPTKTVPDFVRGILRSGLANGWGCPHALERPCSYGNINWHLDAVNTANVRLAYENVDRGHVDDRIETRYLFAHPVQWLTNLRVLCGDRWYVDSNQLLLARELGIIGKLPKISTEQVSDLNKEDIFVKLLAISQIIWLCLQLSMRLVQGVPTTQLEVMTMGYALCSAVTYFLLFDRPKDVTTVFEVEAARYPTSNEMCLIASIGPVVSGHFRKTVSLSNNSTLNIGLSPEVTLSGSFAVFVFGVMHFAAWGYDFPTQTEHNLWRASTVLTIAAVPAVFATFFIARQFNEIFNSNPPGWLVSRGRVHWFTMLISVWILGSLFVAARLFILVEVIRSLAYQPPGSYKTTWAAYVPHVG